MDRIGAYMIEGTLGEGGFGTVYRAYDEQFDRTVAVKVLKADSEARALHARFLAEQAALGMMEHDFIAKIYNAGETGDGRPYFVMEHVDGTPITTYCDERGLGLRERLELFREVCDGVLHAHQKGVIHRDLKPTNILVTQRGNDAVPKVIDFGIARGEDRLLFSGQLPTLRGQVVGTLLYMSPEQAEASGAGIDTRADIYSLGVILYELLVGVLPFDAERARELGLEAGLRELLTAEPVAPSERLHRLSNPDADKLARRRGLAVTSLVRCISGDLDAITLKALAKDRGKRYATARDLAEDVRRYLDDVPVQARPPSRVYYLRKFVRRHRVQVLGAAGVLVAAAGLGIVAIVNANLAQDNIRLEGERAQAQALGELQDAQRRYETGRFAAARGRWAEALKLYDEAERVGYPDAVALTIRRIEAHEGALDYGEARRLLAAVRERSDLGTHRATVLLLDADLGVNRLHEPDAKLDLVREALELGGLEPADRAFAHALEATDVAKAIEHLQRARALDPSHRRANDMYAITLLASGRLQDAERFAEILRSLYPEDPAALVYTVFVMGLGGDVDGAQALIEQTETRLGEDRTELARMVLTSASMADYVNETQLGRMVRRENVNLLGDLMFLVSKLSTLNRALKAYRPADDDRGSLVVRLPPCIVRSYEPFITALAGGLNVDRLRRAIEAHRGATVDGGIHFLHAFLQLLRQRLDRAERAFTACADTPSVIVRHKTAVFYLLFSRLKALEKAVPDDPARPVLVDRARAALGDALAFEDLGPDYLRRLHDEADWLGMRQTALAIALRWRREHPDSQDAQTAVKWSLGRLEPGSPPAGTPAEAAFPPKKKGE